MKNPIRTALCLTPVFLSSQVLANTILWDGSTDNNWTTGSNWTGDSSPVNDLNTDIAIFNLPDYSPQPNAASTSINGIQIGDGTTVTGALTLGGTMLNIGGSGIDMRANAGATTISSPITLGAAQTWQNASSNLLTIGNTVANGGNLLTLGGAGNTIISGLVSGTGALTKSGAGTVTLTGGASYSGNTAINQGTLTFKAPSNAGWTLGGGTKTIASGATMKIDFSPQDTQFLNTNLGATVINGILDLSGDSTSVNGFYNINGLTASGTGSINISGGAVIINSTGALNNFTGSVNISTGSQLSLQGGATTTVGNFGVNIANGGTLDIRTDSHKVGTLTGGGTIIKSFNGFNGTFTIGADNGTGTFTGNITTANSLPLTKEGTGTQTFTGTLAYVGATNVNAGTLLINGSKTGTDAVNVGAAGTLGGTGTVAGALNVTGKLAPGDNSIQSLGTAALSFANNSTLVYELNSTTPNADLLVVNGTLDLAGTVNLNITDVASGVLAHGTKFTLINYANGWTSTELFTYQGNTLADDSMITLGSNQWLFNYDDTTGGSNTFAGDAIIAGSKYVTMTVVPEPSVALLSGLGALALLRRRRNGSSVFIG